MLVWIVLLVSCSSASSFFWPPDRTPLNPSSLNISAPNVVQVSIILPDSYKYAIELEPAQKRAGVGILVGFETAHRRGLLPQDVFFNVTFRDSRCDNIYGPKSLMDANLAGAHVLFGPSCDYGLGKNVTYY